MTPGHVWNQRIWELKESLEIISARGCDSRHFQEPMRYKFVIYKDGAVITEIWWTHRFKPTDPAERFCHHPQVTGFSLSLSLVFSLSFLLKVLSSIKYKTHLKIA